MTNRILVAALLLGVLLPASAAEETDPSLSREITAAELTEHVKILAGDEMEGRRSGTPGGDAAAAYIAARFAAAGLKPGGDDGTFLQGFALQGRNPVKGKCSLTVVPGEGEPAAFELFTDWRPFSFSTGGTFEKLHVTFVGYGIRSSPPGYDDYDGIDVKGRVVVMMRRGPRSGPEGKGVPGVGRAQMSFQQKALTAKARGAAAVLFVDDRLNNPRQADRVPTRVPVRGKSPEIPFVFAKRKVTDALFGAAGLDLGKLEAKIDETGKPASTALDGVTLDLSLVLERPRTANVVAILPGKDPELRKEAVVVGAHYDHLGTDGFGALDPNAEDRIWNGADDNASGTAGLIEVAESLALAERPFPRTLVFVAFAAEELGLLGSGHYVGRPAVPIEQTVAMMNMDMIGRSRNRYLMVGGTGTAKGKVFDEILTRALEGAELKVRRRPQGSSPSDNLFFDRKRVPTLFFFTGIHPDYHRASDHWDKLEYGTAAAIAGVVSKVTDEVARLPARPGYADVPVPPRARVYLGVTPARDESGPGVLIESVMQASPAAKAGLIDGDRILSLGGVEIKGLPDLQRAIRGKKAGDEVTIVVQRGEDGERLELKARLGGR